MNAGQDRCELTECRPTDGADANGLIEAGDDSSIKRRQRQSGARARTATIEAADRLFGLR